MSKLITFPGKPQIDVYDDKVTLETFADNIIASAGYHLADPQVLLDGMATLQEIAEEAMRCRNAKIVKALIELGILEVNE